MKISSRGIIGTIITHVLLLALLIFGALTFPDPPPEEEGILVNFGTDDTGYGSTEPKGDEAQAGSPPVEAAQPVQETVEESVADAPAPSDPVVEETTPSDPTQDVEEAPVKEEPQPTAEEIRQQQEADRIAREEADRIAREQEAERLRKLEEDRIRQEEEAERLRQEAAARERQEKADRLNKLGQNTFGQAGVGEEEGSEGVKPGDGTNQGVLTGSPGADNYGDGSGLGDGISFGLGGRNVVGKSIPDVEKCSVTSRIVVTVEIQVDRQGNVVLASVKSATFSDKCIYDACVAAARNTKFNADQNASYKQSGWIKYTIEP